MIVDRGDFWEFKARTLALDIEIVQWRLKQQAAMQAKNELVTAFALAHGFDPMKPLRLEDTDCSVTQDE
jgi:hypothetical protein